MLENSVLSMVQSIPIIDTHEHFCFPSVLMKENRDVLSFLQNTYIADDLRSVGFGEAQWARQEAQSKKWERLKPFLAKIENTTYYRVFYIVLKDLFGIEKPILSLDYNEVSLPFQLAAAKGEDWYNYVLHQKANILVSMIDKGQVTDFEQRLLLGLDVFPEGSFKYGTAPEKSGYKGFLPVLRTDFLSFCCLPAARKAFADRFGIPVVSFADFERSLSQIMSSLRQRGFVAIKSTLAYYRDLNFLSTSRKAAETAWQAGNSCSAYDLRSFQDYVVFRLAELAGENEIVYEIHTGLRCFGATYSNRSSPHELTELVTSFPETKFDFFHAGWPWVYQAISMAKSLPNVFLNLNWFTSINEAETVRQLGEILDTVPLSKITWGGDCFYVEEAFAHSVILRRILAKVLDEKIKARMFSLDLCERIAQGILRENALSLYSLAEGQFI